uniref:IraD/Gp25-like domain-containing protein n=1 Tax=Candidatus Kentrum sp. SD TaxID=2126332 RepID=A0A451BHU5_9GAMM|nr:MAG: hypothetical protein BECKSD772F_GA0070984_100231 [Candidatus Kentron sp. SD]VFK39180.1 MAG: hypothetical protein BECKSD772E_GA0070983_100231 [Candidatus Kentron sp. SD]VFK77816.1 MAG: hypothetical protein BECKSD772D_GA0070982_100230 [Candidatus Kentron sp. SD]
MSNQKSFLGTGWSFPPAFSRGGAGVEMVSDEEDVRQSLEVLLATGSGERVMQDTFGCELSSFLFEEMDQGLINNITGIVSDAILYHEPRITLNRLEVNQSGHDAGVLLISIDYTLRNTNSRYNMVYPFYLNEASNSITN